MVPGEMKAGSVCGNLHSWNDAVTNGGLSPNQDREQDIATTQKYHVSGNTCHQFDLPLPLVTIQCMTGIATSALRIQSCKMFTPHT
jgi:hypothetical protein